MGGRWHGTHTLVALPIDSKLMELRKVDGMHSGRVNWEANLTLNLWLLKATLSPIDVEAKIESFRHILPYGYEWKGYKKVGLLT